MNSTTNQDFVTPTADDTALAAKSCQKFATLLSNEKATFTLKAKLGKREETIEIPMSAFKMLYSILAEMAKGNAITFIPVHAELTSQQAADFLSVSRPHLISLLESGSIPFHKVGTHRRVQFKHLLEFKIDIDKKRLETLEKLTAADQELGLY